MQGVIILATPCTESLGGGSGVTRTWDKDLTVDGRSMNRMPTSNHRTDHIQEGNVFIRKKQKSCSHFVMREHGFFFQAISRVRGPYRLSSQCSQWGLPAQLVCIPWCEHW